MKVRDLMTQSVASISSDDCLSSAARMMWECDCGAIPVTRDGRVLGMITDRDIVLRVVAEGRDPNEVISVRDVMTNEVVSLGPDADVLHAEELMKEHQIRRVLVVDDTGCLVGIVSMADLARATDETQLGDTEKAITH